MNLITDSGVNSSMAQMLLRPLAESRPDNIDTDFLAQLFSALAGLLSSRKGLNLDPLGNAVAKQPFTSDMGIRNPNDPWHRFDAQIGSA
jgi:hypothetical protein